MVHDREEEKKLDDGDERKSTYGSRSQRMHIDLRVYALFRTLGRRYLISTWHCGGSNFQLTSPFISTDENE